MPPVTLSAFSAGNRLRPLLTRQRSLLCGLDSSASVLLNCMLTVVLSGSSCFVPDVVCSLIASLSFCLFKLNSLSTDSSTYMNSLFSMFSVEAARSFSFFSKSVPICKRLLIQRPL